MSLQCWRVALLSVERRMREDGRERRRGVVVVVKRLQGAAGRSGWAQLSPAVGRDCSPVSAVAVTDWRGETMGQ